MSSDLVEGIIRLMNAEAEDIHLPVNIGNPGEFTMKELAEEVAKSGRAARLRSNICLCRRTTRNSESRISKARKIY